MAHYRSTFWREEKIMNVRFVVLSLLCAWVMAACGTSASPTTALAPLATSQPTAASTPAVAPTATPTVAPTVAPTPIPPTITPSPTPAPAVSTGDSPRDILLKAMRAQFNTKSYRVRSTTLNLNTSTTSTRLVEFAAPDRYHFVLGNIEAIVIGDKSYSNRAGAGWKEDPLYA